MSNSSNIYGGMSYERYMQCNDDSTTHKLKTAYWTTKQAVFKKLGKKEDEHIVASDSQLDSKLELYKSIQKTCNDLAYLTDRYMECICVLSQIENEFGRFLKKQSNLDKTRAGEMMNVTGRSLGHSSQQRLLLRAPLERFYQEINTFRQRAVVDTNETLKRMESRRTDYRGSLMWMKKVSEELDPDTFKQLEKFRKVQAQVKKSKESFDKIKIDSMQKIDLLSASRCNMLSHALVGYQNALINFWDKTSKTMSVISETFKGYQYFEFSMLKELNVETRKLADETSLDNRETDEQSSVDNNSDLLGDLKSENGDAYNELFGASGNDYFSSLGLGSPKRPEAGDQDKPELANQIDEDNWIIDLLNNEKVSKEDKEFFSEIFDFKDEDSDSIQNSIRTNGGNSDPFNLLGGDDFDDFKGAESSSSDQGKVSDQSKNYFPSQLWNQNSFNFPTLNPQETRNNSNSQASFNTINTNQNKSDAKAENASDNWMNLFSELDPTSNPDNLCKKPDEIAEV